MLDSLVLTMSTLGKLPLDVSDNYLIRNVWTGLSLMLQDRTTLASFIVLLSIFTLGIIGPYIAPYPHNEYLYEDGELLKNQPPSVQHPLGTTDTGHDVLSRLLVGARPTAVAGLVVGSMAVTIGLLIGVSAGYFGPPLDDLLMRFTDLVYSVPMIPAAIVLSAFIGTGFYTSILIMGIVLWRGPARVFRSQVLQIKERSYILASQTTGASDARIIVKHIIPNIAPMAILYFALSMGFAIIVQAGLAFIGVSNPFVPAWGSMIKNAYRSGLMAETLWWSIPPGAMIALTVVSAVMFGRGYESLTSDVGDEAIAQQAER